MLQTNATTCSYFLCEKTDGIRLLLYITTGDAGEEIVYLIDRKNDYYYLPNGSMLYTTSYTLPSITI